MAPSTALGRVDAGVGRRGWRGHPQGWGLVAQTHRTPSNLRQEVVTKR